MVDFSPTIGHIDNIPIQLHWTFLFLLIVILFLSLYLFVVWVLLFICVLIHELFHSITSKRNGIKVNKIVLYPFGGGSIIDFENVSPQIEFRISLVGPVASLLLAIAFGISTIFAPAGMINSTLQILFLLNLFLGVFNLLPWLPLDGGRALRSYLQKDHSFLDATQTAVKVSIAVTILFVIGTIVYAAVAQGYSFLYREFIIFWDVAIAFIIYNGAQAELQAAFIKENVSDLTAQDAMTKDFVVIDSSAKISDFYRTLLKNKNHIVLLKDGPNVKILSNAALQKLLKRQIPDKTIGQFGTTIPQVPYNLKLYNTISRMRSENINTAVVIKSKKIEGVLLMQHIESIIALHISQKKPNQKSKSSVF
jgi:Zn-dependent protease